METVYFGIILFLFLLAIFDLVVGVSNDAVNFLSSAVGAKVAPYRVIMWIAATGILCGALMSNGMMEIARHGIFRPEQFFFQELVCIFLAVMVTDVLVLDVFNTLGLPTSTTVSMVFELLGGTFALTLVKMAGTEGMHFADYLNTEKALSVIMGIFLSVAIAFFFGMVVQWLARLVFTFRYRERLKWTIGLFGGIASTAIVYFMLIKGVKDTTFMTSGAKAWIAAHGTLIAGCCLVGFTLLMQVLHWLRVNVFKVVVLLGTFALALAFAGNDLVNFIGVPVAGFDAYSIARHAGDSQMLMGALNENVPANFLVLLAAGAIMILTLWTSKKSMHVTETEISLSAQGDEGSEQYGSSLVSRTIVRAALNINAGIARVIPQRVRDAISRRFEYEDVEHSGAPYDMIRATVNLTTSAMLISVATSLKLPLSTTYVCFMVAMGSSLADKAWGRESAVYRISGVMTVVAGWFITAVGGFLIALAMGLILIYGGIAAFVVTTLLCGYMLVKSNFFKKNKAAETAAVKAAETGSDIIYNITQEVCATMERTTRIYDRTLIAVFKENRKVLREMVRESNELFYQSRERKYSLLPTLRKLQKGDIDTAHYYVQVVDYLNEMTKALAHITRPAFEHIDNNHEGLSKEQTEDLMHINDEVESIYRHINNMLRTGDFSDLDMVLEMRDRLFEAIADAIKSEVTRINENRSNTKASILYLTILNETKSMVLQSRNLLKSQRYFLEHKDGPLQWLNKIK